MLKRLSVVSVFLSALFAASAVLAQDTTITVKKFDPYASIRVFLGYHNTDPAKPAKGETELINRLQSNTRFGAKMEIEGVKAHVEFGLNTNSAGDPAYLRLAYATYDFNGIQFMAGQNYTPYFFPAVGDYADDNNLNGFGTSYDGRQQQIMVSWNGLYVSLIETSKTTTGVSGSGTDGVIKDTTVQYPKVAAGYDFKSGANVFGIGGAYNTVKINDQGSVMDGKKLASWITYAHANLALGDFTLRGNAMYGVNTGNFGLVSSPKAANADSIAAVSMPTEVVVDVDKFEDTKHFEGFINPMYKITQSLLIGLGAGYAQVKNDAYAKTDKQVAYFINAKYNINKYFHIAPEFAYRDFIKDETGADEGTEYYAGAKVQFDVF